MDVHLPGINGTIATQRIRNSTAESSFNFAIYCETEKCYFLWDERCDNKTISRVFYIGLLRNLEIV
jgi:hypothetical protein